MSNQKQHNIPGLTNRQKQQSTNRLATSNHINRKRQ